MGNLRFPEGVQLGGPLHDVFSLGYHIGGQGGRGQWNVSRASWAAPPDKVHKGVLPAEGKIFRLREGKWDFRPLLYQSSVIIY